MKREPRVWTRELNQTWASVAVGAIGRNARRARRSKSGSTRTARLTRRAKSMTAGLARRAAAMLCAAAAAFMGPPCLDLFAIGAPARTLSRDPMGGLRWSDEL